MSWKTIDFQGIISLERPLVQNLEKYLDKRESQLSKEIIESIHPFPGETLPPPMPYSLPIHLKLTEAVDAFSRKISYIVENRRKIVPEEDWKSATTQINKALWSYVEVLEGGVSELFQQLDLVGFEDWNFEMMNVVELIKDLLLHHIEDLIWAIKRLESRLWEFRWDSESKSGKNITFRKMFSIGQTLLDKSLITNLKRSEKFLKSKFKSFVTKYDTYFKLHNKIELTSHKLRNYPILNTLEESHKNLYIQNYELIKLWNLNKKADILPEKEIARAVRAAFSPDKIREIYRGYSNKLQDALYNKSREIKTKVKEIFIGPIGKPLFDEEIETYRSELHTLGSLVNQYREFLLATNPNPYVRSRWGFTEWIVGPEPSATKQLLELVYDVENTDHLFVDLKKSIDKTASGEGNIDWDQKEMYVDNILHEMEQPLISKNVMKNRAVKFIDRLSDIDELGSFDNKVVKYVGKTLSKAIRIDWQHNVLFDYPLFHKLYHVHLGIVGLQQDRKHIDRKKKFQELIDQIQTWIKNRESQLHIHEIEQDMNDMKGYLQDFLAHVQRSANVESQSLPSIEQTAHELTQQLLEYRYLFGNFFNQLQQYQPEGKTIRQQFLFVDQYFESADSRIFSMNQNK